MVPRKPVTAALQGPRTFVLLLLLPAVAAGGGPDVDPARVRGAESCRECHASEYSAWTHTRHFRTHRRIESPSGRRYIRALGSTDLCQTCHSTPHTQEAAFTEPVGVSCESCHGASGGENGWFTIHADYGGSGLSHDQETAEHRTARLAACDAAGMFRPQNSYGLALRCYTCHIVGDESLLEAGHRGGHRRFELLSWIQGEVRHNFHVDPNHNAESPSLLARRDGIDARRHRRVLWIAGRLAELETCLRRLAAADPDHLTKRYAGRRGWAGRAEKVRDELLEKIGPQVPDPRMAAVVEAVRDLPLGRHFRDQAAARKAAEILHEKAKQLLDEQDQVDLAGLDPLIENSSRPRGTTWQP